MKYFKIFILLFTTLLAVSCESTKKPSFIKGNPYSKDFARLNGPVKSVVYATYLHGKVVKTRQHDYSPEGVLIKSKTIEKGDSIVWHYIYDPSNNIQDINGTGIADYKAKYQKGTLVKEWFYSDTIQKQGFTNRYRIKGETYIKKVNDIKTGRGTTYTYYYNSKGLVQAGETMVNNGSYHLYQYDKDDHPIAIFYFTPKGKLRYKLDITCRYDTYGNCVKYVAKKGRKVAEYAKINYQYYTEEELQNAQKQAESTLTNINVLRKLTSSEPNPPSQGLMTAIIVGSIAFFVFYLYYAQQHWDLFHHLLGKVEHNGMRKMWMYNSEPYVKISTLFASVIGAFLSAITVLLLCGGVVWVIFWAVNLLLWGLIIVGWGLLISGIAAALGRKTVYGIPAIIVGLIVVANSETLQSWGKRFVDWGSNFLDHVNAIDWTLSILRTYGKTALLLVAIPLISFLAIALVLIVFSYLLRAFELAAIKRYNVNRPCPICGNKKDFDYMVGGKAYPIELRPGVYGVFHQTNHLTGTRVPTMLLNGKSKLTRRCPHCEQLINISQDKTYGTDLHIGIVGNRSSGKSYLLYSGLELLSKRFGKDFQQIDADSNSKWESMVQRIHHHDGIQTAVKNRYKAIQIRLKQKMRMMPYQLFFYDVAGEKFNVNAAKTPSALEFYTNVKTVVFIIDPTLMDIEKNSPSNAFTLWYKKHGNPRETYDLEATISTLKEIIEQVGRKTKDIDLIVTCTKKDLDYLQNSGYPYNCSEPMLKRFINEELGLYNLDNVINSWFKSVGYAAVSATDADPSALEELFMRILKQRGVSHLT